MQAEQEQSSLAAVPSGEVYRYWNEVKPVLAPAIEMSDETESGIYADLLKARAQLWFSYSDRIEAALITKIQSDKKGKFCLLLSCAGENLSGWQEYVTEVEMWARSQGCKETRLYGRRGWAKILNMNIVHTKMVKTL